MLCHLGACVRACVRACRDGDVKQGVVPDTPVCHYFQACDNQDLCDWVTTIRVQAYLVRATVQASPGPLAVMLRFTVPRRAPQAQETPCTVLCSSDRNLCETLQPFGAVQWVSGCASRWLQGEYCFMLVNACR